MDTLAARRSPGTTYNTRSISLQQIYLSTTYQISQTLWNPNLSVWIPIIPHIVKTWFRGFIGIYVNKLCLLSYQNPDHVETKHLESDCSAADSLHFTVCAYRLRRKFKPLLYDPEQTKMLCMSDLRGRRDQIRALYAQSLCHDPDDQQIC